MPRKKAEPVPLVLPSCAEVLERHRMSGFPHLTQVVAWTDGSCPVNKTHPQYGSMGIGLVVYTRKSRREWGVPIGNGDQPGTNQIAEIRAVRHLLEKLGDRRRACAVKVCSDSQYTIGVLTDPTWQLKKNVRLIQETRDLILECGYFEMAHTKGHADDACNCRADELAGHARKTGELVELVCKEEVPV